MSHGGGAGGACDGVGTGGDGIGGDDGGGGCHAYAYSDAEVVMLLWKVGS